LLILIYMKTQLNEIKRMQFLAGLISESQVNEAAGDDLELKSLAKKLFPIIKKYKMGVEYVTDSAKFNTKPASGINSTPPASLLIKDGILTIAVYFLSLARSINEIDMGSGPSEKEYQTAKSQAAKMYKELVDVIGANSGFEFMSAPTMNEFGFYIIKVRKAVNK